jgi:hypothetical protein
VCEAAFLVCPFLFGAFSFGQAKEKAGRNNQAFRRKNDVNKIRAKQPFLFIQPFNIHHR